MRTSALWRALGYLTLSHPGSCCQGATYSPRRRKPDPSLSHRHRNELLFPLCCACFLLPHLRNSYETRLHSLYAPELLSTGLRLLHNVTTLTPPSLVSMELVPGPVFPFLAIWVHEFLFGTPQLFISPVHTPVFYLQPCLLI